LIDLFLQFIHTPVKYKIIPINPIGFVKFISPETACTPFKAPN